MLQANLLCLNYLNVHKYRLKSLTLSHWKLVCDFYPVDFASKMLHTCNNYQMYLYHMVYKSGCLRCTSFLMHLHTIPNTMKIILLLIVVQMYINMTISQLGSVKHALRYEVFKCQIPFSYHDILSYDISTENLTVLEIHINHVNKHIHHLGSHSIGGKNIIQVFGYLIHCWRILMYKCSSGHPDQQLNEHLQEQLMCGVIDTGMRLTNTIWYIKVYSTFGLQLNFLQFYLPSTKDCSMAKITIFSYIYSSSPAHLTYCRKRMLMTV